MNKKNTNKWSKKFPRKEGMYWFYGYRYGKISCGTENKPEFMLVKVHKISNGIMYVANGQFMFKSETEEPHFMKIEFPELPEDMK